MRDPQVWSKVLANGDSRNQYFPPSGKPINVKGFVELLENSASRFNTNSVLRRQAFRLLDDLAADRWWIAAGIHEGGHGDSRGVDKTNHLTIVSVNAAEKVHCQIDGNGWFCRISYSSDIRGGPHHHAPGTPVLNRRT